MTGSPGSRRPAIAPWVHVAALAGYTVLCVAWSLFAGRDLNWDQLNHHLYLGHLWHHGRLDRDFMAAGGQSYYNPLPYLPFHALVVGGWSSNTITALLGVLHSLNAWLLHAIGWSVFRGRSNRFELTIASVVMGLAAPIFLIVAGTSYGDPVASLPVLAL